MKLEQQLIANRLSWRIEGEYFDERDIKECKASSHIKRMSPAEAQSRAEKIVDAYFANNPSRPQKRVLSGSERRWEKSFDDDLESVITECINDIKEYNMVEQGQYLQGADD